MAPPCKTIIATARRRELTIIEVIVGDNSPLKLPELQPVERMGSGAV
jgi:hypothetical protein